jgi:DeoR/GlpR family transcriptional regulator of sugar metabolism
MMSVAVERIVLADHTKFSRVALCQIAPLSMVDMIITDRDLDPGMIAGFEQQGIQVTLA